MKTNNYSLTLVTLLILLSSTSSVGQGLGVGISFGMNAAKWSNWSHVLSDAENDLGLTNPSKIGIHSGFVLNPMFNKIMGIELELNFDNKGEKIKDIRDSDHAYVYVWTFNYLTVPILLKGGYSFGKFSVYGLLGPYVGIALNGKEKVYKDKVLLPDMTRKVLFGEGKLTDDEIDDMYVGGPKGYKTHRLDFGLTLGLQPGIRLGPGDLVMDLRYNWGFIDIENPTDGEKTEYNEKANHNDNLPYYPLCNRNLTFSIGYIFRLGGDSKK